jgi:hypothetical protein
LDDPLPKTRLTDPFVPFTRTAFETQRFNWVESLMAPIVVFNELKAGGQLGAVAQLAEESRAVASKSIQGAYRLTQTSKKVINRKIKGPN